MKQNRRDAKPQKLAKLSHLYEMICAMIVIPNFPTVLADGQESNPEPVYRILRSTRRNRLDPHCYHWYVDVAVRLKVPLI
jgi:hypothetical protein